MHARLSQMIYRAAKQCPHHPAYEETYSNTRDNVGKMGSCEEEGLIGMGNMSQMSMETLVFGGAILALVDSVLVALSMPTSYEVISSDPLSGQKSLTVPSDVELLDYNNLNTTIGELIELGKGMVEEELGSLASYSASEKEDIGLDVLLRSLFLDVDGSLTVPVNMMVIPGITMESVCLADLDTFTLFDEIYPIAAQTFQAKLHMDSWNNVTKLVKDYSNFVKTNLRTRYIFIHASLFQTEQFRENTPLNER